jgi:pyruvate dehydrogenase E2 component (dihydrolipoamide acetyltransferase)
VVIGSGLDEGIAIRDVCTVAITYDHRALDGATAARFTTAVAAAMEGESDA